MCPRVRSEAYARALFSLYLPSVTTLASFYTMNLTAQLSRLTFSLLVAVLPSIERSHSPLASFLLGMAVLLGMAIHLDAQPSGEHSRRTLTFGLPLNDFFNKCYQISFSAQLPH